MVYTGMDYQLLKSSHSPTYENSAFLYGQSCFTTIKIALRKAHFIEDHWERLKGNAQWLWNEEIEIFKDEVFSHVDEFCKTARLAAIRISFFKQDEKIAWVIHQSKLDRVHQAPLNLKTIVHPSFNPIRPNFIKAGSYFDIIRQKDQAIQNDFDDILLTHQNKFIESSFGNIIFIKNDGKLYAPVSEYGMLSGITRKHFLKSLIASGLEVIEEDVSTDEFKEIKAAFVTSSIKGVVTVAKINETSLETETEEVLKYISLWREYVEKYHE